MCHDPNICLALYYQLVFEIYLFFSSSNKKRTGKHAKHGSSTKTPEVSSLVSFFFNFFFGIGTLYH